MWGNCNGKTVLEHRCGKGKIIWGRSLRQILSERGVGPDFHYTGKKNNADLDYIHRHTPEAEIYFIRNKRMRPESVDAHFRVIDKVPELWFPDTGRIVKQLVYEQTANEVRVPLKLGPAGSLFIVFRKSDDRPHLISADSDLTVIKVDENKVHVAVSKNGSYKLKTCDGRTAEFKIDKILPEMRLNGPWKVCFPAGWGAPDSVSLDKLISWTDHDNPGIRYFSGLARYEKEIEIPQQWLGDNSKLYLDLGQIWCIGEVFLNGQSAGIVWKPPYRADITNAVKTGSNRLEVEIANTWANRLVGDAHLPEDQHLCRTNITGSGTPRKSWRDVQLRQSGLLGPVRLVMTIEKTIELPGNNPNR